MSAKPLSPSEIENDMGNIIPEIIINAVNNLLKKEYRNGEHVILRQDDIIAEVRKLSGDTLSSDEIYENKWLDFEPLFNKSGWKVEYDKPGRGDDYEAYFKFTPKRKK